MILLSKSAVKYAVDCCQEMDGYKAYIAVCDLSKYNELCLVLSKMASDSGLTQRITNSNHNFEITFSNGSFLRLAIPSEASRGMAVHLLVADKNLPYEILHDVLQPCEKIEYLKYVNEQRTKARNLSERSV